MTKKSILQKAAKKLLKENVGLKKGERVLIVTDRKNCLIFKTILDAGKILDFEFKPIKITMNRKSSSALPYLKKDFVKSDVIIGITDKSISHCPEVRLARKKFGTRVISIPGINEELFIKAMSLNKEEVEKIGLKLAKKIKNCHSIKITTPSGTDLKAKVVSDAIFLNGGIQLERVFLIMFHSAKQELRQLI